MQISPRSSTPQSPLQRTNTQPAVQPRAGAAPSAPAASVALPEGLGERVSAWAERLLGRLDGLASDLSGPGAEHLDGVRAAFQEQIDDLLAGIRAGSVDAAEVTAGVQGALGALTEGMGAVRAALTEAPRGVEGVDATEAATAQPAAADGALASDDAGPTELSPEERVALLRDRLLDRLGNAAGVDVEVLREAGNQLSDQLNDVIDGLASGELDLSTVGGDVLGAIRNLVVGLQGANPDASAPATVSSDPVDVASITERLGLWTQRAEARLDLLATRVEGTEDAHGAFLASMRELASAVELGELSADEVASQVAQVMESLRADLAEAFPGADAGRLYGRDARGAQQAGQVGRLDLKV